MSPTALVDSPPQTGPDDGVPPTANAIATAGLSMATASATVAEPEETRLSPEETCFLGQWV